MQLFLQNLSILGQKRGTIRVGTIIVALCETRTVMLCNPGTCEEYLLDVVCSIRASPTISKGPPLGTTGMAHAKFG